MPVVKGVYLTLRGIEQIAERLGWDVEWGTQEGNSGKTERYADFYKNSPAGEDFGFTVFYENAADLVYEVQQYSLGFDVDEHIEMWIEARNNGVAGVPSTVELCKDAEAIDKMVADLAFALIDAKEQLDRERAKVCLSML